MKKIVIIAGGVVAKHFLDRVITVSSSSNTYIIVHNNDDIIPQIKRDNFKYYRFDPTSYIKLSAVLSKDIYQVMVILPNRIDTQETIYNIQKVRKNMRIVVLDKWELEYDDENIIFLNANDFLAGRFIDYLPNIPVFAKNVGLGAGEIMEIRVPFGSAYVYRHISTIEQRSWKIAAVYRGNRLILARPTLMIQPNDILLLIGSPVVLEGVYKNIKSELGQFPIPFGRNIYVMIDMLKMDSNEVKNTLDNAILVHSKLNSHKLIVKVLNPTYSDTLDNIKSIDSIHISLEIDYREDSFDRVVQADMMKFDIGLVVVSNSLFKKIAIKRVLYNANVPILKLGFQSLSTLKYSAVLAEKGENFEKFSPIVFDISSLFDLDVILYDFNPDKSSENRELKENFENFSQLFNRKVNIIEIEKNPIRELKGKKEILHFIPFSKKLLQSTIFSFFSTSLSKHHFLLKESHQIFMPVIEEKEIT